MVAYQDMIATREHAYAERLPRADALLASGAVDKLQQRDVALENELRSIEAQHDVASLGTGEEREQWARIQRVEAALNGAPDNAGNAELRARLALVRGVLFFRLNDAYGARLWQEHRELKDLSLALHETQSRWIRVERARKNVPANTGEFATRVAALMQRIDGLEVRLVAAEQQQRDYLAQIAVRELEQQKDRVATYQIQARFALGTMYDRAASSEDARPAKVPVPVQKGVEQEAASRRRRPNEGRAYTRALALRRGARGRVRCARESSSPPPTIGDLTKHKVEVHKDTAASASATKAMENYRRFLELQNTDPKLRAEAMRRLGDLNLDAGELERLQNEVTAVDLQGGQAIKLYTTLLKAYPDYARNDQVLYQLGRAYETTGQPDQALATLDRIVQQYPQTPHIDEVQFRRGELLFSAKRYPEAEHAYAAVISHGGTSAFYQQSLYKHGWSLFKQSQTLESLPSFGGVLDRELGTTPAKPVKLESLKRGDRELVEDTLRVMSIAFSYNDGAALPRAVRARARRAPVYLVAVPAARGPVRR